MADAEAKVGIDVDVIGGVDSGFQNSVRQHIQEMQKAREEVEKMNQALSSFKSSGGTRSAGGSDFKQYLSTALRPLMPNWGRDIMTVALGIAVNELAKQLFSKQPIKSAMDVAGLMSKAAKQAAPYIPVSPVSPLPAKPTPYQRFGYGTTLGVPAKFGTASGTFAMGPAGRSSPYAQEIIRQAEMEAYHKFGGPIPNELLPEVKKKLQQGLLTANAPRGHLLAEEAKRIVTSTLVSFGKEQGPGHVPYGAKVPFVDPRNINEVIMGLQGKTGKDLGKARSRTLRVALEQFFKTVTEDSPEEAPPPGTVHGAGKGLRRGGQVINPAVVVRDLAVALVHGMRHGAGAGLSSLAGLGARAGSFIGQGALGFAGITLSSGVLAFGVYEGFKRFYRELASHGPTQQGVLQHIRQMYGLTSAPGGIPYTLAQGLAEANTRQMRIHTADRIQTGTTANFFSGVQQGLSQMITEIQQGILDLTAGYRLRTVEDRERVRRTGQNLPENILLNPLTIWGMVNLAAEVARMETPSQLGSWSNRAWTLPNPLRGIDFPFGLTNPWRDQPAIQMRPNQFSYQRGTEPINPDPRNPNNLPGLPGYMHGDELWNYQQMRQNFRNERQRTESQNYINRLSELISFPNFQPQILTASQYRMGIQAEAMRAPGDQARFQAAVDELQKTIGEIRDIIRSEMNRMDGLQNPAPGFF